MATPPPPRPHNGVAPIAWNPLSLEPLMSRLQLRPPFLDTNSFLSQSLEDFLLQHEDDEEEEEEDKEDDPAGGDGEESRRRRMLAKEETKLEKEIIRIIRSGGADEALKPNSGQSVTIGDHNICVAFHEDKGSEYRVWEWHGHIMLFDYEDGYSAEYIYGNYFERLEMRKSKIFKEQLPKKKEKENDDEIGRDLGLRDLIIGDSKKADSSSSSGGRVLHRNAIKVGSSVVPATE